MTQHYDSRSRHLHWITAILVIGLWILGQTIDDFDKGWPRVSARSLHILAGVLLALVLTARIAWRRNPRRQVPAPLGGWQGALARWMHGFLYVALVAVVVLGLLNTFVRGDSIFGLLKLPAISPGNTELRHLVEDLHAWAANTLAAAAVLHALGALYHRLVLRDQVLARMLP
jgi:cytochrome b561